jgi:hypothetical protein
VNCPHGECGGGSCLHCRLATARVQALDAGEREREAIAAWIEADNGSWTPSVLAAQIRRGDHHKSWSQLVAEQRQGEDKS